jgi:phenylacetic acid degradation operon negative regulatory protein
MTENRQPRAMILSVFGAFLRRVDGWMPIAALIDLMAQLAVDEQSVRSAMSRLKRRGVVLPQRRGGIAGYALGEEGASILRAGDTRIYERRAVSVLADGWVLATFSVPDSERPRRHVLRTELSWLGFASLSPGVWIAPGHVADEALAMLERQGLDRYVEVFRAHHLAFADPAQLVARCWDLDALAGEYRAFLRICGPILDRWSAAGGDLEDAAAFADYVRALTLWRRLPFMDPGLPVETLPAMWPGEAANDLFHTLVERLDGRSLAHVRRVLAPL